jgi:hypothetical protein
MYQKMLECRPKRLSKALRREPETSNTVLREKFKRLAKSSNREPKISSKALNKLLEQLVNT